MFKVRAIIFYIWHIYEVLFKTCFVWHWGKEYGHT